MRHSPAPERTKHLTTDEIRTHFLIENLFTPNKVVLNYWNIDRAIIGSAVPTAQPLPLEGEELAVDSFTERRELGILNIGPGDGRVEVGDKDFDVVPRDVLYIGRNSGEVSFQSDVSDDPARFYFVSYPAHERHPTRLVRRAEADLTELGDRARSSRRDLLKYVHPGGAESAQLVMGITEVAEGNVWNTMPAHTHERRSEVYLYFGLNSDEVVFHLMGEPQETRSVVVRDGEAVLSPSWSIHGGAGTSNYTFCWAMGGENQDFDDMQRVEMQDIL